MPKHVPERTCIATRAVHPQHELLRFVRGPDGAVVPDLRNRLPGRGAWLTPTAEALRLALKRKAFARAFKSEATASADLVEEVDVALKRDLLGALALANKAGGVTAGFTKVEAALRAGAAAALIHAREAQEDGRRKLAAARVRASAEAGGPLRNGDSASICVVPTYDDLDGGDLDVALGRVHVIHAALLAGAGSEGCLVRWRRLRVFRGVDVPDAPPRDADQRSSRNAGPEGRGRELQD